MGTCAIILLIIATLFLPPLGVFFISGCSVDLLINVVLTLFGYLPGHIHAFYLVYVYYDRRSMGSAGRLAAKDPPLVFSKNILHGGEKSEPRPQACRQSHRVGRCHEHCGSNGSNCLVQGEMDDQTVSTVQRT